jgi:hypothetical protein
LCHRSIDKTSHAPFNAAMLDITPVLKFTAGPDHIDQPPQRSRP